jgi:hypothetical protein
MTEEPEQLDLEDDYLGGRASPPRALPNVAAKALKTAEAKRQKASKPPTRAHLKLLDAAVEIGLDRPTEQDAVYMARELVQCTLPHKNPGDDKPAWTRKNGNLILSIRPGWDSKKGDVIGYPFGTIPRLLLFWMTTEAVRTQTRRLELGNSLAGFMHELGLSPSNGTGKRSDARRLRDQMHRLFHSLISFESTIEKDGRHGEARVNMIVAGESMLWWSDRYPNQAALWGSWIELGDKFFQAITAAPVPVDVRALKALKSSPLALDLYAWLTHEAYRAHKSGKGRFVAWPLLMEQLGAEYSTKKNFSAKARATLRKVATVYPALKLGSLRAGVRIEPESFPAIQPKPSQTIDLKPSRED